MDHENDKPEGMAEDLLLLGTMTHVINERLQQGHWCPPCIDQLHDELGFYIAQQKKGTVQ